MSRGNDRSQSISSNHEQAIHRFERSLAFAIFLKYGLALTAGWFFVWGLFSLTLRATSLLSGRALLWGALGIIPCLAIAALWAKRETPPRTAVQALLDDHNHCGGLLMAATDADLGDWRSRLPELVVPRAKFKSRRTSGFLALATAFVALSLIVPVRMIGKDASRPLEASKEAEDLKAEIEILKETQILEEAKAKELEQKLDQIVAESSGDDPARTWESLDHLADALEKTASDASEQLAAREAKLDRAEALAEGLAAGNEQLDAATMTEAMTTLEAMMQNALKENDALAGELSKELAKELADAIKSGALSQEHLGQLSKALNRAKSSLQGKQSKLAKSGAIDPKSLKGGAGRAPRDNSGLAAFLKENAQNMSVEEAVGQWCDKPGKGGVNRGRGDAAMTWTDGSSEKGAKFKEQILPPAGVAGLEESQLVGLSATAPTADAVGVAAHGALNSAKSGGGSAYTQPIPPHHKAAVQRYFERK